jgi:uncharacterized protein with PIN domain
MEPKPHRFFADAMLGRLAKRLRLAGFDMAYERAIDDADLVARAQAEARVILTRDRRLLERRAARGGILVRGNYVHEQWTDLAVRLPHLREGAIMSRCAECNTLILPASPEEVRSEVPPYVFQTHREFYRCPGCGKIYWPGTHVGKIRRMIEQGW